MSGQRHAQSNLLPVTLGSGTRELVLVPVEQCWFHIIFKVLEATLADLIRVHYITQYFVANTCRRRHDYHCYYNHHYHVVCLTTGP